jgi:hypothetical protein
MLKAILMIVQEYDVGVDNTKTPAERLARQKQNLRRRLGNFFPIVYVTL